MSGEYPGPTEEKMKEVLESRREIEAVNAVLPPASRQAVLLEVSGELADSEAYLSLIQEIPVPVKTATEE